MHRFTIPLVSAWLLLLVPTVPVRGDDKPASAEKTVEQLAASARKSIVIITVTGRDGKREGLGTGFVVGEGLIATNLHVVGEARPVTVELVDGKRHEVTEIHASSRQLDLALVRIDAKNLTPLPLGDARTLKDGQAVVALGNPHGLTHSVVAGVVSGKRDIDGRSMIQVAIPIERGNSGGPLLDMQGRVVGIMTAKSLVTANLGFAVEVNALKSLIQKPNPVPMSAWLTIGALDPEEWKPMLGARWRQRAGRMLVEGWGTGFGGRSFCLHQVKPPELPYELAVTVKLDDEAGAAGLIFHADGGDQHYGFYPSGGGLRLTRFDGPDVFTWKILEQIKTPRYRPGEWNTLKVRMEKDGFRCYVNDHLVAESRDRGFKSGLVGLAKFRATSAEFKHFKLAKEIPTATVPAEVATRIKNAITKVEPAAPASPELLDKLAKEGPASLKVLRQRAKQLEEQAAQLRQLALAVHQQRVQQELLGVLKNKGKVDLMHAALLLARLDNDELDIHSYLGEIDRMAKKIAAGLPKDADDKARLAAMNRYLFKERGFHGSRSDYYNRSNSYLNEVLDDREGLPITLSLIYMELGRRLGMKIEGVGLPGHFVVRHVPARGEGQLIDVYEGGTPLSKEEAAKKVETLTGGKLMEEHLTAVSPQDIVVRMLHNLLRVAQDERDMDGMLRYLDTMIAVAPDSGNERGLRAAVRYQKGDKLGAITDLDWLLDKKPEGVDLNRVRQMREFIDRPE